MVFLSNGTFQYIPVMFKQMYSLHTIVDGTVFPVAFALMEKTLEAYENFFGTMKEKGVQIKTLMGDFEKGPRIAVQNVFGRPFKSRGVGSITPRPS